MNMILNKDEIDKVVGEIYKMTNTTNGKHEKIEETINRAKQFILEMKEWQRSQIAGISLEPHTTTP